MAILFGIGFMKYLIFIYTVNWVCVETTLPYFEYIDF